jgi:hypothetical protein
MNATLLLQLLLLVATEFVATQLVVLVVCVIKVTNPTVLIGPMKPVLTLTNATQTINSLLLPTELLPIVVQMEMESAITSVLAMVHLPVLVPTVGNLATLTLPSHVLTLMNARLALQQKPIAVQAHAATSTVVSVVHVTTVMKQTLLIGLTRLVSTSTNVMRIHNWLLSLTAL